MFDSSKVKESEALAKLEDELGHEISYFSSAAMGQFEKDEDADSLHIREGLFPDLLLSARLGRQSNVSAFRERTLRKVYNQFFPLPQDHMRKAEYHEKNVVEYGKARKTFRKRYVRVMGMIGERSTALSRLSRSEKEKARIAQEIEHLEVEAGQMEAEIDKAKKGRNLKIEETCSLISDHLGFSGVPANSLEDLQSLYYGSKCGKLWGRYQRLKAAVVQASSKLESVSVGLFQKRRAKIAERYLENAQLALFDFCLENDISEAVLEAYGECREALAESLNAIVKLDSTVRKAKENLEKSKEKTLDLRNKEAELDRAITDAGPNKGENERYVRVCPELIEDLITTDGSAENADAVLDRRKRAHLSNPDYDEELAHERGLLFLDALNLIEKFVLASKAMESNLRNLGAMWGMEAQHEKEGVYGRITFDSRDRELAMPALMQTLFILAPVVSSTFASVGRLLRDVRISKKGSAPFGLLVVDEAGQAVPEAALGALVRCRRALVVGDPCQIPPVVSSEHDAIRGSLSNSKVVGDKFINKQLSVQQLADSQNSLGSYLRWNSESESGLWVGCPLVVHRRCISPIFDILNEVFYNDAMFKETRTPSKEAEKRFYWSSSQWIDVSGKENGNGDHYVPAQGRRVMIIVAAAFEKTKGDIPSLYLISPFKTVADGLAAELKEFFKDNKGIEDKIEDFARDNIGTIHSFQGKEADEVVFVLGCDHKSKRSTEFVNENIVNVAVSRAKYRLYIVGSYHAWKENRNIVKIKKVLDTQWLEHFERWKKHGDASELEIARKMIPAGESFPTENVDDWEGDASVDMEPYLSNVSAYLKQEGEGTIFNMIDDSSAKQFGFASKDSIQEEFAKVENVGKGIAMGIFLYNVLGVGKANIEVDASPCAVGFGSAFEGYMGKAFWKSFSKLPKGDMLAGPKKKDSTWMPTLGNYEKYLNRKTTRDELSYLMSQAVHEPAHSPDAWGRWWDKFVKGVSTVKEIRNSGAHPGKVVSDEDVAKQIDLLFGDKLSRENKQKRGLFRHEEAAEILRRAVSDSALVREAGDMFEHATNGNEVDDSVSIDKEKKKNGRREAEESARKSILNAEEEMSLTKSIKRAEEREYWPSGLSKKASEINALIESLGLITPLGHGSWLPTKEGKLLGIGVSRGTDKDATWCVYTDSVFREIVRRLEEA